MRCIIGSHEVQKGKALRLSPADKMRVPHQYISFVHLVKWWGKSEFFQIALCSRFIVLPDHRELCLIHKIQPLIDPKAILTLETVFDQIPASLRKPKIVEWGQVGIKIGVMICEVDVVTADASGLWLVVQNLPRQPGAWRHGPDDLPAGNR